MSVLFSPPVILIGGGLGLVILLMGSKGHASTSPGSNVADPNVLSASVQMNQIASDNAVSLASISAQAGSATQQVNLQEQGQLLGFLENTNNNNTLINQTIVTSTAGITNNQITQSYNLAADIQNNGNRLALAQQQAQVSADQAQASVNIATIQANASKQIAKTQAIGGIFQSVVAGASKVATAGVGF
jgi:hypothetical protein